MKPVSWVIRFYGRLNITRDHTRSWNQVGGLRCYSVKKSVPHWSKDEVLLLHELKRQHSSKEEILAKLPRRSWPAITGKWNRVGQRDEVSGRLVYRTGYAPFSSADVRKALDLREAGYSVKNIASKLEGRTPQQVSNLLYEITGIEMPTVQSNMGLARRWTPEEINKLQHLRRDRRLNTADVASILKRSLPSVHRMSYACGFVQKLREARQKWTADEDATLIRMYDDGASLKEIQRALPSRKLEAVISRKRIIRHRLRNDRSFLSRAESEILSSTVRAMRAEGKSWKEIASILPMHSLSLLQSKLSYERYGETRRAKQASRAKSSVSAGGNAVKVKEEADVKERKDSSRKSSAKS